MDQRRATRTAILVIFTWGLFTSTAVRAQDTAPESAALWGALGAGAGSAAATVVMVGTLAAAGAAIAAGSSTGAGINEVIVMVPSVYLASTILLPTAGTIAALWWAGASWSSWPTVVVVLGLAPVAGAVGGAIVGGAVGFIAGGSWLLAGVVAGAAIGPLVTPAPLAAASELWLVPLIE